MADVRAIHQFAHGAVHRDGVGDRRHGADHVGAVGLGAIEAAHPRSVDLALVLVEPLAVGLPEVEHGPRDRLAAQPPHRAGDEAGNSGRALGHVAAMRDRGRIGHVERSLNRARGRFARPAMVDRIDQHAHAQHVRGEDEFLPLLRAQLAGAGEPIDRGRPFGLGRLDVAHEPVEVLDQGLHDLPQARIGNVLPALQRDIGQVVFGHIGHGCLLESGFLGFLSRDFYNTPPETNSRRAWLGASPERPRRTRLLRRDGDPAYFAFSKG